MKKTLLAAAALAALAFAGSASATTELAGGTLSYNIGVTNDYVFRGLSQTDGDAALQGGVDYSRGLFYVGTWASNVSFADHELDLYAGVKPTLGKAALPARCIWLTKATKRKRLGWRSVPRLVMTTRPKKSRPLAI